MEVVTIKTLDIIKKARKAIEDKQGKNITLLDVRDKSGITDYYLITTGLSSPHLRAIFHEIHHILKREGLQCYRKSGDPDSGWLVIDYMDVVIHIFSEEARQYYAIEELWAENHPDQIHDSPQN